MIITNRKSTTKTIHYKVNGQRKTVKIPGNTAVNLPDLQHEYQLLYNDYDIKIDHIIDTINRPIIREFDFEEVQTLFTYVFTTIELRNNPFTARDGASLVSYENELRLLGGWDPINYPITDSIGEDWVSDNDAVSWTQNPDAPWSGHTLGIHVKDGKIFKYGNDLNFSGRSCYTYDSTSGWQLVTNDMGEVWGERYVPGTVVHKGYLYAAGGMTIVPGGSYLNDVIRSEDGITWETVGSLPVGFYFSCIMYSDGDNLIICGGGAYLTTSAYNDKVFKSSDDGFTWEEIATLPVEMRTTYPNGVYWDNKLWYLNGYGGVGTNQLGLYYSSDLGITWTQLHDNTSATHASALCVHNDKLFRVTGNLDNYSYSIEKVPVINLSLPSSNAALIYSYRNDPTFIGDYAFRARNRTSGEVLDIGFIENELDTASLLSWAGSDIIEVAIQYDRSGNGYHLGNTPGNCPVIVSGSTVLTLNGKPASYHSSTSEYLTYSGSQINLGTKYLFLGVFAFDSTNGSNGVEFGGGDPNVYHVYALSTLAFGTHPSVSTIIGIDGDALLLGQQRLMELYKNDAVIQPYINGTVPNSSKQFTINDNGYFLSISGENDANYRFRGYFQELMVYSGNQLSNKYAIESNVNSFYSIY